jgi:hypothetical protein
MWVVGPPSGVNAYLTPNSLLLNLRHKVGVESGLLTAPSKAKAYGWGGQWVIDGSL